MNKVHTIFSLIMRPFSWFWRLSRRNKIIVLVILCFVAFLGYRQIRNANAKPQYITQKVTLGNIIQLVSETGNVSSGASSNVYSSATGVVEEVYVTNNEAVEAGQQLFKVKSTATEQEKAAALSSYLSAKNTLDTANATLYTLQSQLFAANQAFIKGKGNTNDPIKDDPTYIQQNADWLAAEANYKKQQGVISAAQAALSSAALAYQATQNTVVKAAGNGRVANLSLSVGDMVSAKGTATTVVPALIILSDASIPVISVSLNEVDVPKVHEGESVNIVLDALPEKTFKGTVRTVDGVGTNIAGVVTYNVSISIASPDQNIKPGMTANVDIEVDKAENVLTVPNSAIKPYQGKKAIQVIDPKTKTAKFIPVKVGIKSPQRTEIISGVDNGTEVIIGIKK